MKFLNKFYTHPCKYVIKPLKHWEGGGLILSCYFIPMSKNLIITWRLLHIKLSIVNAKLMKWAVVDKPVMVLIPLSAPGLVLLFPWLSHLSLNFLGGVALYSLSLYGDTILELVFRVGQLCLGETTSGPLPHHPQIHHRDYIERVALNAKTE